MQFPKASLKAQVSNKFRTSYYGKGYISLAREWWGTTFLFDMQRPRHMVEQLILATVGQFQQVADRQGRR